MPNDTTRQADALTGAPEMPEPVALATSLLGDYVGFTQPKGMRMRKRDPIYTAGQMRAYGQAMAEHARRVALEEAAKLCEVEHDARAADADRGDGGWSDMAFGSTLAAKKIAAAIRAAAQQKGDAT